MVTGSRKDDDDDSSSSDEEPPQHQEQEPQQEQSEEGGGAVRLQGRTYPNIDGSSLTGAGRTQGPKDETGNQDGTATKELGSTAVRQEILLDSQQVLQLTTTATSHPKKPEESLKEKDKEQRMTTIQDDPAETNNLEAMNGDSEAPPPPPNLTRTSRRQPQHPGAYAQGGSRSSHIDDTDFLDGDQDIESVAELTLIPQPQQQVVATVVDRESILREARDELKQHVTLAEIVPSSSPDPIDQNQTKNPKETSFSCFNGKRRKLWIFLAGICLLFLLVGIGAVIGVFASSSTGGGGTPTNSENPNENTNSQTINNTVPDNNNDAIDSSDRDTADDDIDKAPVDVGDETPEATPEEEETSEDEGEVEGQSTTGDVISLLPSASPTEAWNSVEVLEEYLKCRGRIELSEDDFDSPERRAFTDLVGLTHTTQYGPIRVDIRPSLLNFPCEDQIIDLYYGLGLLYDSTGGGSWNN